MIFVAGGSNAMITTVIPILFFAVFTLLIISQIERYPKIPFAGALSKRKWLFIFLSIAALTFYDALYGSGTGVWNDFVNPQSSRLGFSALLRSAANLERFRYEPYINTFAVLGVVYWILLIITTVTFLTVSNILRVDNCSRIGAARIDNEIAEKITTIWNNEKFLNCLKTSLPKGAADDQNGLDYVPFMLENIEMRRNRFQQAARSYLRMTIAFSIISALAVMYLGYIVVIDTSAGLPRALFRLEATLGESTARSGVLLNDFKNNDDFRKVFGVTFERIEKMEKPNADNLRPILEQVVVSLARFRATGNIGTLDAEAKDAITNLSKLDPNSPESQRLSSALRELALRLKAVTSERDALPLLFASAVEEARKTFKLSEAKFAEPSYQTAELWRRLSLGIIICTFLFVVLRFFANLYRQNYNEELKAASDDLTVRKFVVRYRASGDDLESRRSALNALASMDGLGKESKQSDLGNEEAGILKEIIGAVSKKI